MQALYKTSLIMACCLVMVEPISSQDDGKYYNMHIAFGNLHAHSSLSDDVHYDDEEMSPIKAFEYAHSNGLDFLAITDHHKAEDSPRRLFLTQDEYKEKLYDVAMEYNRNNQNEFVAIPGIEWGNTATGNHLNVLGSQLLPSDAIKDADYDDLYAFALDQGAYIQFNHPRSWFWKSNRSREIGNFGQNLYEDKIDFCNQVDPVVKGISIICSVEGGHINGDHRHSEAKTHRDMQWEHMYRYYLNMGFHISPTANQDTHWKNWGTVTSARTAVWTKQKKYDSLINALKENRVYATEDDELAVVFQVEYEGKRRWMGEIVQLEDDSETVDIILKAWQVEGTDGDEQEEGPYTFIIKKDSDGIGGREATPWMTITDVGSAAFKRIPMEVKRGDYIYVEVTEENGQDHLIGQGPDENNNETGENGADGLRDDPNDSAWTSPIWFE